MTKPTEVRDVFDILEMNVTEEQTYELLDRRARSLLRGGHPVCQWTAKDDDNEHCLAPSDVAIVAVDLKDHKLMCVEHAVSFLLDFVGSDTRNADFNYEVRSITGMLRAVVRYGGAFTTYCPGNCHMVAVVPLSAVGYDQQTQNPEIKE